MTLISLNNLSFRPPGAQKPIWERLNLDITPKDRLLIIGDSGIGKSTLLHIMANLTPKLTDGKLKGDIQLNYEQSALVQQNPENQIITPTVFEEVAFALENRALPEKTIKQRTHDALRHFNLLSFSSRETRSLSGGEQQRLSLACAFAQDPDILFLDEPTAYLDPCSNKLFFHDLIEKMPSPTLVFVEHQFSEIKHLINRVIKLTSSGLIELEPETVFLEKKPFFFEMKTKSKTINKQSIKAKSLSHFLEKTKPILKDINAQFSPGKISTIIGPSGSGKSTLLKKIAGISPPEPSTLFLENKDVTLMKKKEHYQSISYLPQNPEHYFLHTTVSDEWQSSHSNTEKIEEIAGLFKIKPNSDQSVFNLSEGEKRRLTLGLVFLENKPIILLDEPTFGLDEYNFLALVSALKALRSEGRTIIVVTHSPKLIEYCADEIWFLSEGTLSKKISKGFSTLKSEESLEEKNFV